MVIWGPEDLKYWCVNGIFTLIWTNRENMVGTGIERDRFQHKSVLNTTCSTSLPSHRPVAALGKTYWLVFHLITSLQM